MKNETGIVSVKIVNEYVDENRKFLNMYILKVFELLKIIR